MQKIKKILSINIFGKNTYIKKKIQKINKINYNNNNDQNFAKKDQFIAK